MHVLILCYYKGNINFTSLVSIIIFLYDDAYTFGENGNDFYTGCFFLNFCHISCRFIKKLDHLSFILCIIRSTNKSKTMEKNKHKRHKLGLN